jgi:hypothetical protein
LGCFKFQIRIYRYKKRVENTNLFIFAHKLKNNKMTQTAVTLTSELSLEQALKAAGVKTPQPLPD